MSEINFLQVGDWAHCLICHTDIPRDEFLAHASFHKDYATSCDENCVGSKVEGVPYTLAAQVDKS